MPAVRDLPLIVLLGEQRPYHPHQRVPRGEDPDHPGPSLDLLVQTLERVRRVQPPAMLAGEVQVREHVLGRVLQELRGLREALVKHPGHVVELIHGGGVVGLDEDGAHDRGHRILGLLGNGRERVPHEVRPTSLPGRACKDLGDRLAQALVGIGDDQPDTPQTTLHERSQERGPELVVLRRTRLRTKDGALPVALTPIATTVATEITRPASRTLWNVASSHT